jgi:hypothetical protein
VQRRFSAEGKDRPVLAKVIETIDRETKRVADRFASTGGA